MKKKKLLLILLPIVLILIAVLVIAVLFFTTDLFIGRDELFLKYISQNSQILKVLENGNIVEQENLKKSSTYTTNGNLTMSMPDAQGTAQNINMTTASRYDKNTQRMYSEAVLKNGEADLLKASYINSGDVYAIKCDDIIGNYVGVRNSNLKDFAKKMGMDEATAAQMPDKLDFSDFSAEQIITEREKQHIINTYINVIKESINKDKYSKLDKSSIVIENQNYECNGYALTLDGDTIKQIIVNCLNKTKEDEIILNIFNRIMQKAGQTQGVNLSEEINNIITNIQGTTINNTITITVYERNGKLLRTTLEISDMSKITIDLFENTNKIKVILGIESYGTTTTTNVLTNETESINNKSEMQITLERTADNSGITNYIEVIPSLANTNQKITITKTIGNISNGNATNSAKTSISDENGDIISSSYGKTIQITEQIEEIPELKNSNTVIFNNYTKEQLTPFMEGVTTKATKVIGTKFQQLAINLNTSNNSTTGISNQSQSIMKLIASSAISIANGNGVEIENTVVPSLVIGTGAYVYQSASNVIDRAEEAKRQQEEAQKHENEIMGNMLAQHNEIQNNNVQ